MRGILTIEDLPAGVSELAGEELETVAGIDIVLDDGTVIQAGMNPGSGYVCTASAAGDCRQA
ncbi:hypothetical protein [Planomonospora sp. ID82291]|uniref:hypothetical protein n=1 Tax=Planomonospora sp. ID82291 TaxID=2738136 RepID=UPI0018C3A7F7|nr:hypothetical protein [Planomonospora sp. ID82291]MBG0814209.1 hypothetical protein [Planomonospora sp. ID82291]